MVAVLHVLSGKGGAHGPGVSGDGGGDEARSLGGMKGEVKVPGRNGDSHTRLPGR